MIKRESGHSLVQSTIRLEPIAVWDSQTCIPLTTQELNETCTNFLLDATEVQNRLIEANYLTLPHRANDDFGTKWARDNIVGVSKDLIPDDYIEKYWTLTGCKIEAARIILAWQHRRDLAEWLATTEWEGSFAQAKEHLSSKWLDYQLYENVKRSREKPKKPVVTSPRFPFNQMSAQVAQQVAYQDVLWVHNLALGATRCDIIFDAAPLWRRYRNIASISRPTLFMRDSDEMGYEALFDFTVTEDIEKKNSGCHHAIGFDRNMDHVHIISGSRVNIDGSVSRELGPSLCTLDLCQKISVRNVELARKRRKLDCLMPWQDRKRQVLEQDIRELRGVLDRLHDAVDASVAADIVGHYRQGDTVGLENLSWSGGGPVKFRHGRTDETVRHALDRAGIPLRRVSAVGTTSDCPVCGAKLAVDESSRVVCCPSCLFEGDRDAASSPVIGERALEKIVGADRVSQLDCSCVDSRAVGERSERKRRARLAKMNRRRERGSRVYRVKDKPSPRRPCSSVSGVCVSDDGLVGHVGVSNVGSGDVCVVGSSVEGSDACYVVNVSTGVIEGVFVSREEFARRRACELRAWREHLSRLAAGSFNDGDRPFLGTVAGASIPSDGTWAKANALHPTRYGQETCYAYLRYHLHDLYVPPPSEQI